MDMRRYFFVPFLAAALMILPAAAAAAGPPSGLDLVVKITRLEQILNWVDAMAGQSGGSGPPPTMMLQGMLQGTDWIDPGRSIVIGVEYQQGKTAASVLIPFRQPNPNFAAAFNAGPGSGG